MPCIRYITKKFSADKKATIDQAVSIVNEYQAQGYTLTLRQIYYQFVARDMLPNVQTEYKRLGTIISDARLAGMIDWEAIEDRTRNLESLAHWDDPQEIVRSCSNQFRVDRWDNQPCRVEVWIEKEALAGVFADKCREWDVPFFSCRGYVSQSEMWRAARRLMEYEVLGQNTLILHFGDHDPSGIDMTRDIRDRLELFGAETEVERIALNMDQIDEYQPPPNPTKVTDSRADAYIRQFGNESWELDALEPSVLNGLVESEIDDVLNRRKWKARDSEEKAARKDLRRIADQWDEALEAIE